MNKHEAKAIIERLKTDGLLSDNEIRAIEFLTSTSVCHCRDCEYMQRSPKGDAEFFCRMHHKFFQEIPVDQFCSWGRSKTLFESLSDDLKESLDKAIYDDVVKSAMNSPRQTYAPYGSNVISTRTVIDKELITQLIRDVEKTYPIEPRIIDYQNRIKSCRDCKHHGTMVQPDYSDHLGYRTIVVCKKDKPQAVKIENLYKPCEHYERKDDES